jgi:hypothetical protein
VATSHRQRGQALPLGLALLLIGMAAALFLFNAGQLTIEKMRLTNTADAVAYSAGIVEARALNYDAITNRAMIANEVAIGQAVSLAAWDRYVQPIASELPGFTGLAPVDLVLTGLRTWSATAAAGALAAEPATAATVLLHARAMRALAASQWRVHGPSRSNLIESRRQAMERVAQENDPDVIVDPVPLADDFGALVERRTSRAERGRMADLVRASTDRFVADRSWAPLPAGLPRVFGCEVGPRLVKRGGTEFIGVDGWKGMDTLSLHVYGVSTKLFSRRCTHVEKPVGYGSAKTRRRLPDAMAGYGESRRWNPAASARADANASPFLPAGVSAAIPSFHELASPWIDGSRAGQEPRAALAVRVYKTQRLQAFSGGRSPIVPRGRLALFEGDHRGEQMSAVARVEVFFDRTLGRHPSGALERASLFSPYWQVRLGGSDEDRRVAAKRQGAEWPF